MWNTSGNEYIVDGKKIKFSIKETLKVVETEKVMQALKEQNEENKKYVEKFLEEEHIKKFIESNKIRLNYIMNEAIEYIREQAKN